MPVMSRSLNNDTGPGVNRGPAGSKCQRYAEFCPPSKIPRERSGGGTAISLDAPLPTRSSAVHPTACARAGRRLRDLARSGV